MAMAFAGGQRNVRRPDVASMFDPLPYYGTPGIGDDLPGNRPIADGMGFGGAGVPQASAPADGAPRMAFRGPGAGASVPASLMPLDTSLAPSGLASQTLSPLPGVKPKKAGFFDKDGAWRDVLGAVADAMATASGGQPIYFPTKMRQRQQQQEWDRQDALRRQDRQWALEDRQWKLNQPDYFNSGRDRVRFDPVTGESTVVYDGPTDFQEYADLLGLEPGSDEYDEAMQDFVLRSNGPTAQAGRAELEGIRQNNRVSLESVRQNNRAALRQMPTYANLHPRPAAGGSGGNGGNRPPRTTGNVYAPILAKIARGEKLSAGEQQVIGLYGGGGRSGKTGASSYSGGNPVAVDAKGNKVQYDPVSKAWRPVR